MKKDYNMGMEQDLEQQETNSKKPNKKYQKNLLKKL